MAAPKTQDLPPPGGYKPISFARVPPKSYFSGISLIAGYLGITAGASYLFYLNSKQIHIEEIEQRSASMAIYPLLLAERDRELMKQMRRNRDEEARLMANVEGWKVGTWYGEPVYHTLAPDTFVMPRIFDYYSHAKDKDFSVRANFTAMS